MISYDFSFIFSSLLSLTYEYFGPAHSRIIDSLATFYLVICVYVFDALLQARDVSSISSSDFRIAGGSSGGSAAAVATGAVYGLVFLSTAITIAIHQYFYI